MPADEIRQEGGRGATLTEPTFPPRLSGLRLAPGEAPLDAAIARARNGEVGAGDVLWSPDGQRAALAIVLEPECPLRQALQMAALAQVAAGDCLGALTPPQVGVTFRWPRGILVNRGRVGGIDLAWPKDCALDAVPDWLVVAISIALKYDADAPEPGFTPHRTVMAEEGCPELGSAELIESYVRHFLTWLNEWQDEGFRPVSEAWSWRAEGREEDEAVTIALAGRERRGRILGLDEEGNVLLKPEGGPAYSLSLLAALSEPEEGAWP